MDLYERVSIMEEKQRIKEQEQLKKEAIQRKKRIEKEQQEKEKLIEIERLQRKQEIEKEQKEYEKGLIIACENDLKNSFDKMFNDNKHNTKIEIQTTLSILQKIDIRNTYLKEFGKSGVIVYDYLDENYEKILNKVYKKWENNIKSIEFEKNIQQQIEEYKNNQEQQKEQKKIAIYKLLINIFFILVNPITIILYLLIWGYFAFAT